VSEILLNDMQINNITNNSLKCNPGLEAGLGYQNYQNRMEYGLIYSLPSFFDNRFTTILPNKLSVICKALSRTHNYNLLCITVPSNGILIAALIQSIENKLAWWRIESKNSAAFRCFFQRFDHSAALKGERKMSHLNIAFVRYTAIGTNALQFGNKSPGHVFRLIVCWSF